MAVSSVRVTEGSGPYLHTWQRSISSVNREDQFILLGEPAHPTFSVTSGTVSFATTDSHCLQVMAGSTNYVRIHHIRVEQLINATNAAVLAFVVLRLTTAGTGGSSVTPAPFDTADTATATAMTLPSSKGTEGAELARFVLNMRQTTATSGAQFDDIFEWTAHPRAKPIIIPAGTANGIAIKCGTGVAAATGYLHVEFTETAWL